MNVYVPAAIASDRPDYAHLNDISLKTLSRGYLREGIAKADLLPAAIDRLEVMITAAETELGIKLDAVREGARRGWMSPASPVWSNYGEERGLPISCNGSYIADRTSSILLKTAEIGQMTKNGAGTSAYLGALRPFGTPISGGGTSEGPVHFARLIQEQVHVISQSNVRRGNCAIYLDIEHPDIHRWLDIRSTEGGVHHPIQHLSFGICISRAWWAAMKAEPKGGEKRKLITKIRNKRRATGYPYLFFTDNANDVRPQVLKDLGLKIHASNLCTEIMLHSTELESFVCNLSSVNLLYYHEWKGTKFVWQMVYFLDAVLTEYIRKIKAMLENDPEGYLLMSAALRFAEKWRAIGLGTLGYHSALQAQMIPFESAEARAFNVEAHAYLAEQSDAASRQMAIEYGEPEGLKGTGYRHLTRRAIAPTKSSSIICGQVSNGIEPWPAVVFENDNAKGVFTQYNPFFVELAQQRGYDTPEVWTSILEHGGAVDHLDWLSDLEKAVFKPWQDMDQREIVQQTADRQPFIDQGQSMNIMSKPSATLKEDIDLMDMMERLGVKSAYYHKGTNKARDLARENIAAAANENAPVGLIENDCVACEA